MTGTPDDYLSRDCWLMHPDDSMNDTLTDTMEDLMARLQYGKFLEKHDSPALTFEEWKEQQDD